MVRSSTNGKSMLAARSANAVVQQSALTYVLALYP